MIVVVIVVMICVFYCDILLKLWHQHLMIYHYLLTHLKFVNADCKKLLLNMNCRNEL